MPTVYDIPATVLIRRLAEELKTRKEISPPEWTLYVKTGAHKERAPDDPDWWYVRCASVFRKIYLKGPVGTQRLRIVYGGRQRRGTKPNRFRRGSGAVVRTALQQLEKAGFIKKQGNKGRVVTDVGRSYLDKLSGKLKAELSKAVPGLENY
jgi:small subunit ribosomal protein S19e